MTTTIEAVFERGVFRPIGEVELSEGTRVEVIIPQTANAHDPRAAAAILSRIASTAPAGGVIERTSENPDAVLYNPKNR